MSDDAAAIQAKVDVLAKVFLARLPVRYEKMNAALALCRADPGADEHWTELLRLLHSLAGAAGTFGCDTLGTQAGMIELLLKDMLAQDARSLADADEVGVLLAALQSS